MALVEVTRDGSVATLALNRPELRNALSIDLCDAICDGLEEIRAEGEARVVVVRGKGKAFCAGADFAAVSGPGGIDFLPRFERMLEAVVRFELPTVAQIHGAALGGGFQLACVCDFRIVAESGTLGIPAARLGIVVNIENVRRLVHLVGMARARSILMTGHVFTGPQAADEDLVQLCVADADLEDNVAEFARGMAMLSPLSVQGAKRSIQAVMDTIGDVRGAGLADELDRSVTEAYNSDDLVEGLRAMSEKRPPDFRGR
ncbi:MAG: enoyl-CoA hydratase-related protein [Actinomycetota bacterium]